MYMKDILEKFITIAKVIENVDASKYRATFLAITETFLFLRLKKLRFKHFKFFKFSNFIIKFLNGSQRKED